MPPQRAVIIGIARLPLLTAITIHKDMIERLPTVNEVLAEKVRLVLEQNKAERHIRGGEATRQKYKNALGRKEK